LSGNCSVLKLIIASKGTLQNVHQADLQILIHCIAYNPSNYLIRELRYEVLFQSNHSW